MLHSRKEKTNKRISESEQQKLPNLKREKINWKKKIKRTMECCRPTDEGRQHTVNRAHRHVFLIITKNIQPG